MKRPHDRAYCCYCKRELTPPIPERSTSLTRDHTVPMADGGVRWVPCCLACNRLKGSIALSDWFWFIRRHPRWWKTFRTNAEVSATIREHRFAEAVRRQQTQIIDPPPSPGKN